MRTWWVLGFVGCSGVQRDAGDRSPGPSEPLDPPTTDTAVDDPPTTVEPIVPGDPAVLGVPAADEVNNGRFASATVCAECHSNAAGEAAMRDGADRPVGMADVGPRAGPARDGRVGHAVSSLSGADPGELALPFGSG